MSHENSFEKAIRSCGLFFDIPENAREEVLCALSAKKCSYRKGETVVHIGDRARRAGILLSGSVEISFYDAHGNCVNINRINAGDLFGAAMVVAGAEDSPLHLFARSDSTVLFLDFSVLLQENRKIPPHCATVTLNLMKGFAKRSLFLNRKIQILGQKRLRDKLKIYFSYIPVDADGRRKIPFTKTQLAEYLCADRSALSRELRRMQDENILSWDNKYIRILDTSFLSD